MSKWNIAEYYLDRADRLRLSFVAAHLLVHQRERIAIEDGRIRVHVRPAVFVEAYDAVCSLIHENMANMAESILACVLRHNPSMAGCAYSHDDAAMCASSLWAAGKEKRKLYHIAKAAEFIARADERFTLGGKWEAAIDRAMHYASLYA